MKLYHQVVWFLAALSRFEGSEAEDLGDTGDASDDATPFLHFVAHNKTMTCTADEHSTPFNNQIRGANLRSSGVEEELKELDQEGRAVLTRHNVKVSYEKAMSEKNAFIICISFSDQQAFINLSVSLAS